MYYMYKFLYKFEDFTSIIFNDIITLSFTYCGLGSPVFLNF